MKELISAFLIIGIFAQISIPNFIIMFKRSKDVAIKSNMHMMQTALEEMSSVCDGYYPIDCGTWVNEIRNELGLPALEYCPINEGNKSIAGVSSGYFIPIGECVYLPYNFVNPVLPPPALSWFSNPVYTASSPPSNWYSVIIPQNAGCVHYIPWNNTQSSFINCVPAYAIVGQNSIGGDIKLYLVKE